MAGNPFRRQQRLPDETTYGEGFDTQAPATALAPIKTKKKKRVVIQTPPHSPEEPKPSIPRRFSDGRTGSPPPPVSIIQAPRDREEDETDSTTTADSDLERAALNTRRNSGSMPPPPQTAFGGQAGSRAPNNPFARTLATSEARFGLGRDGQADTQVTTADGRPPGGGAGRPALDVDAFTSILMGGSAAPSPSRSTATLASTSRSQAQQRPQDSSSSGTDSSSLSRHSIFDSSSMHDIAHPESPRTSFDDPPDDSDGDDGDDEHSSLMGPVSARPVEEGPPAPPKHKHGRAFPQTVSFADFDENIPAAGPNPPPRLQTPTLAEGGGLMRPSTPRSPSDLNKPLPPPPASVGHAVNLELPQKLAPASYQPTPAQIDGQGLVGKKTAPPPPPVSRRRGQGSETGQSGRARSESDLSQSSAQQAELKPTTSADQNAKPAPPPPPSRRANANANSSTPSPAVEVPPSPPSQSSEAGKETKAPAMPPPPPRRNPSMRGIGTSSMNRTPSNASRASLPRSDSFTAANASGSVPPAPPPRRGAKRESMEGPPSSLSTRRSSVEHRRTSGQSFGSASERSVSLQRVAEPDDGEGEPESVVSSAATEKAPPGNVLADLDAFQAEIEALRVRSAGGGG